ncbi:MAG: pyridoxamine 5'-phosphate oxidase family protein, partial [Clostridiales bacterium]|nr:pyridoxamine 5'-phosphate oxidase family protein [Clostridiales bacterium]
KIDDILKNCEYGTLACLGDDGFPYAVPLNYYYDGHSIYFHSALKGHKLDAIKDYSKVSFSIVKNYTIKTKDLNTHFESVVIFGKASIIDGEEKKQALYDLGMKYSYDFEKIVSDAVEEQLGIIVIVKIDIEHKEGKVAK